MDKQWVTCYIYNDNGKDNDDNGNDNDNDDNDNHQAGVIYDQNGKNLCAMVKFGTG